VLLSNFTGSPVTVPVPAPYLDQFSKKMFCQKSFLFNVNTVEAALLSRNWASVRTFVIPFYYGSGSGTATGTVINYGSYGSSYGSAKENVIYWPCFYMFLNI
jgi:hypothetical protein